MTNLTLTINFDIGEKRYRYPLVLAGPDLTRNSTLQRANLIRFRFDEIAFQIAELLEKHEQENKKAGQGG